MASAPPPTVPAPQATETDALADPDRPDSATALGLRSARETLESVVVRFAGDSGDGMQLTGTQFAQSAALGGHGLSTFPDYPAEIRAPAGTPFGVSAFQVHFGASEVMTPGDISDVLVAMNPAALKANLERLRPGGLAIVDTGSFTKRALDKAGYAHNPLDDQTLDGFRILGLDITKQTIEAVKPHGLGNKDALRCKNMWTLGLTLWMFGRDRQPVIDWLTTKFAAKAALAEANVAALNAGHAYGETAELGGGLRRYSVLPAEAEPGEYRTVTGNQALSWGLVAATKLAGLDPFVGSYPITPASPILHTLSGMKQFGVITFQAEDEIAAICAALGASYAGQLGITSSSGPGIALKTEALGLAIATELPLVVVNCQRGGPSTGLPTKTEQSDLYQAIYGRNGDAPLPVIAASGPADCFHTAIEATRIAIEAMTPVIVLTDGFMANAAEPWRLPDLTGLAPITPHKHGGDAGPFERDPETLARAWVTPGTPDRMHRIGGIEKDFDTGHISYDAANHQRMTRLRADKVARIARRLPDQRVEQGSDAGGVAVVGWGSTYGALAQAVRQARREGIEAAHIHLRHLNPFPANLGALLSGYEQILVAEMNNGQLASVLRDRYRFDLASLTKVSGQPFTICEVQDAIARLDAGQNLDQPDQEIA
ncbi:2-oxoglutarate ferredoxin oxidoreductase subunit alpha [Rhodothalassium salexigens]|uniref:2-oxoacid:acceptor oxidoreductase subunit alpha n=1 Tax=Rhodothalassium salexigens TaxID=1086 RepID=UPI00191227D6|nr:2-oxoacid:acceptor oxidoreductase subunit alpha [Rhodothalassium salexigens]MBK5921380.1 2-oxoglutarate ferredoxin oxidoreductase subunit alpha [Rhodothalassium salexigens]